MHVVVGARWVEEAFLAVGRIRTVGVGIWAVILLTMERSGGDDRMAPRRRAPRSRAAVRRHAGSGVLPYLPGTTRAALDAAGDRASLRGPDGAVPDE